MMKRFAIVFDEWLSNKTVGLSVLVSIESLLVDAVGASEAPNKAIIERLQSLVCI